MKNLLFVTVGISGINEKMIEAEDEGNADLRTSLTKLRKSSVDAEFDAAVAPLCQWHRSRWRMAKSLDDECLGRHTSSELLVTAKILDQLYALSPAIDIGKIILLASNTPAGQLAAQVDREVMLSEDYAPVRPKPKFAVDIERIPAPSSGTVETLADRILEAVNKHRESDKH